ncbi:MAG: helix-hairpin-helix domain-containing protein [Lachnospiraceae bacterium]|nr:helix-hairpin-helix domain-containing protein [Lachnospiraceae bacterium]
MKLNISFFLLILCALLSGCAYSSPETVRYEDTSFSSDPLSSLSFDETVPETDDTIYVSVMGEVVSPGVYILPENSRVFELINEAGGTTKDADLTGINMVLKLTDGMQLYVPGISSSENSVQAGSSFNTPALININTATLEELSTLTGIGATRAKAIIDYREKNGPFNTKEDLMLVNGIKQGIYDGLKDEICTQ